MITNEKAPLPYLVSTSYLQKSSSRSRQLIPVFQARRKLENYLRIVYSLLYEIILILIFTRAIINFIEALLDVNGSFFLYI